MKRRQLLYGVAAVGGAIASGAGVNTTTAQSSVTDFTVSDAHVESESDSLEELWIQEIHTQVAWVGFDVPADKVDVSLDVSYEDETVEDASTHQVTVSGDEYEGVVETQLPSVNLVSVFESASFELEDEGMTTFEFTFTLRATVVDAAGHTLTAESTDDATAVVIDSEDETVDVIDSIVITTDGTEATIFNGSDEDICVTLEWLHSGQDDVETQTFVNSGEEKVQEPPGGAKGAPSYDIDVVGYTEGECE